MAYTETGYKRSMRVTITKTGNDGSVVTDTYDGQGAFDIFPAIASPDDFRRLERNQAGNGDWDVRLAAFKNYIIAEAGQAAFDAVNALDEWVVNLSEYEARIMLTDNIHGDELIVVLYSVSTGLTVSAKEDLTITFDTGLLTGETVIITSGINYSNRVRIVGETINDVTNEAISLTSSDNGIYTVIVDDSTIWEG